MDEQIPVPPAPPEIPASPPPGDDSARRILAALSYVIWVVAAIALVIQPYKDDRFVRFHAVHGLALGIAVWVLSGIGMPVFGLGWLIAVAGFVYQVTLALKAWNGEMAEIPIISGLVKSFL